MRSNDPFPAACGGIDGTYTVSVPVVVFDHLLDELTGGELKVYLYIIRRTLGFHKEADAISLSQFEDGIWTKDGKHLDKGCGLSGRTNIKRALTGLEQKRLIEVFPGEPGSHDSSIYHLILIPTSNKKSPVTSDEMLLVHPQTGASSNKKSPVTSDEMLLVTSNKKSPTIYSGTKDSSTKGEGKRESDGKKNERSLETQNASPPPPPPFDEKENTLPKEEPPPSLSSETLWKIVQEELQTTFTNRQRATPANRNGLSYLLEDGISEETLRTALRQLDTFQRRNFTLTKFYEAWLPGALAAASSLHTAEVQQPPRVPANTPPAYNPETGVSGLKHAPSRSPSSHEHLMKARGEASPLDVLIGRMTAHVF